MGAVFGRRRGASNKMEEPAVRAVRETDKMSLSSIINKFSAEFCKEVDVKNSAVSSPLSAELVLALLALGSTGRSHDEILQALHLPDDTFVRTEFPAIAAKLTDVKGIIFNIANKIYVKDGPYELKRIFKDDAVKVFGADVEKINFDNGAAAAKAINKWVEGKTNDRIKDLLSKDSINADTRLILINAIYFKGLWKKPFNAEITRDAPFHINSKQTIKIPFMAMEKRFKYGESQELDAKLLEMPYEGDEASLLVVLPNQPEGLDPLLNALAAGADLEAARNNMSFNLVRLRLPKFKIETTINLKALLTKLGIKSIFDSSVTNKDLSGLLEDEDPKPKTLYVSQAVQKAFIEVNEEGSEAAAATAGVVMVLRSAYKPEPRFVLFEADRPFVCAVRVRSTLAFWAAVRGR